MKIILNQFRLLFTYTKNPFSTLLFYLGFKKDINCNLKQYGILFLNENNKDNLGRTLYSIDQIEKKNLKKKSKEFKKFIQQIDKNYLVIDGVKFYNSEFSGILWEYFHDNPFLKEDYTDRTIIDVGANIGDTSLFMANSGAKVYSFEPVPDTYNMALQNIELNPNLKDKIKIYNYAIDGEHKKIKIYTESNKNSGGSNSFVKTDKYVEVEAYTITEIIKKYKIKPDILKLDCEGAEYSIIKNSDLSCFNEILMEYHEEFVGISYKVLIDQLEKMGFNVQIKKIEPYELNEFGFIIATNNK